MKQDVLQDVLVVSWKEGVQFAVAARKHRLLVDQPAEEGGQDAGITPMEMFAASLGTCIGHFIVRFCQRHGISTGGLNIRMGWAYAERPHRVGKIKAEVRLPVNLGEAMRERLLRVAEGCTVHHSLMVSPKVSIDLAVGQEAG